MKKIDAHLHVFARESSTFPRESDAFAPPDREETAEKLLEHMEAHGVDQAVLVQIGGRMPEHHAYLVHCLKTYARRFLGIGLVPDTGDPADHMDRLAGEAGIIGFRLMEIGGPEDIAGPVDVRRIRTYRAWAHAADKGYVLWLYPREEDARLLPPLMEAFPEIRAVFNHLMVCRAEGAIARDGKGRPRIETPMPPPTHGVTLGLSRYGNVCVHLSGQYAFSNESWPYRDLGDWHRKLLETFGAERLMWASDFPWILDDPGYGRLTRVLEHLLPGLSPEERAGIMGETARRFLGFPDPP